jgi:uncharacterized membrane protein YkvA (DUF1232 family)
MSRELVLEVIAGIAAAVAVLAVLALRARRDPAVRALIAEVRRLRPREQWRLATRVARDRRVPLVARVLPVALVGYLLLPIDLIPDFIPVIGQLDDLLILVLTAWLIARLVPAEVITEHRLAIEAARAKPPADAPPDA